MNAIEFKNISFCYEENEPILSDVSISFNYGEVSLISGSSGSGKSTFMYIASGIIPHTIEGKLSGKVYINGSDISSLKLGDITQQVGVVLQNADEQIVLKIVEDEIAFGCENLGFKQDRIEKQIDVVTKLMKLDRKKECRKLSGGQKQRLITASTLAIGQKIIFLDEPLANLDKEGAIDLLKTLRTLAKNGYAIIIIEHRIDLVLPFVDNVYHLENQIVEKIENKTEYLKKESEKISGFCRVFDEKEPVFIGKDISFRYIKKEDYILKNINFEIKKSSRNVILGENGAGKSTLLKLIAKINKVKEGHLENYIDGKFNNNKKGNKHWFKKVGYVYQNPDYQLFMKSVEEEMYYNAHSKEYADYIADLFNVHYLYKRHPQSLSEGQKRRLTIATILAMRPEVLLLDEPTVGQDTKSLEKIVYALNKIHEETGNTMIIITHDFRCAEALADNVLLLENSDELIEGDASLIRKYFGRA